MSIAPRSIWQIGLVVDDLEAAAAELGSVLGLEFEEPIAQSPGGNDIRVTLSRTGLPYFELIEGAAAGPWDGHTGSRLDHLAYFADDLAAERERLVAEGFPVIIDGAAMGIAGTYHLLPRTNVRIQPVDGTARPRLQERWGLENLDGPWLPASPWQLGFMVDDQDAARDELSRALGLEWSPVKARGRDGTLKVCMSLGDAPPYFELVDAGPSSDFTWRPAPRFDHLAYWAEDLEAESARLTDIGAPLVQVARPGELLFHHAPKSGVRLELMAGAYREKIRAGWDLENVG